MVLVVSMLLNLAGKTLSSSFSVPGWFDSLGTFLSAYITGPIGGAGVALLSSCIYTAFFDSHFSFAIVGIFIGVGVGLLSKKGGFDTLFQTMTIAGFIATGCVILSTAINLLLYNGTTGNVWGDGVRDFLIENNWPKFIAAFIAEFYLEFPDKLITSMLLFLGIKCFRPLMKGKKKDTAVKSAALLMAAALTGALAAPILTFSANADEKTKVQHTHISYIQQIYNGENGLECGHANAIAQTSDGVLWIGTYAGLYRYNGSEFSHIGIYDDIRNVNCLYVDQKDQIWVGTNDNGVVMINSRRDHKAIHFANGLPSDSIRAIVRSSDGLYYVGTTDGLVTLELSENITIKDSLPDLGYITRLSADENGNVAAVSSEGRAYILKGGNIVAELNDEKKYSCSYFKNSDTILIGTNDGSISEFSFSGTELKHKDDYKCGDLTKINNIFVNESDIWVCSDGGIGYINEDREFVLQKTKNFDYSVENMLVDYQGNLWFASSRLGLLCLTRSAVTDIFADAGVSQSVVHPPAMYNGLLYVGTDNGLISIDLKKNEEVETPAAEKLSGSRIRCIMPDSSGRLWICSYGMGLVSIDKSGKTSFYDEVTEKIGDRVRVCCELSDGTMAVSSSKGVFFVKDGKVTGNVPYGDDFGYAQALCFLQDTDGTLYAGTDGNGIAVIKDGKYERSITRDDGLTSGVILRLVRDDEDGSIYIVTSNSICRMADGKTERLKNFPYSNNYDVIIDDDGVIFVPGSSGIYILNKKKLLSGDVSDYKHINSRAGLVCSLTANAWNAADENKSLYLSADRGVFKVNLDNYTVKQDNFLPLIHEIKVDDVSQDLTEIQDLTVSRKAVKIEFLPEIINYTYDDPIIAYRLEGLDNSWTKVKQSELNSAITYTNLSPGEYTFRLAVFSEDGTKLKETTYTFEKETAIYDNIWFRYYMIGVAAVFIGWLTWFISRRQIERTLELQQAKLNIALQQVQMGNETILAIARTVDAKDVRTSKHSQRVSDYSALIAGEYGFSPEEKENIRKAALLHDIGKIGIPDSVLNKPGRLTDEEYAIMKTHVTRGAEILKDFTMIEHVAEGARYHHERYDGKGYPDHLAGEDIPLYGRIISIADAFDAMTANRVYRKRQDFDYVMGELHKGRGTQFDPELLDIFLKLIDDKKIDIDALYADAQQKPEESKPEEKKSAEEEKKPEEAKLSFQSFDGGGPEFIIVPADKELFTFELRKNYNDPDHAKKCGSAFDVTITFRGLKPGETSMTIEERSPCAGNFDRIYQVKVDEKLNVSIEEKEVKSV